MSLQPKTRREVRGREHGHRFLPDLTCQYCTEPFATAHRDGTTCPNPLDPNHPLAGGKARPSDATPKERAAKSMAAYIAREAGE